MYILPRDTAAAVAALCCVICRMRVQRAAELRAYKQKPDMAKDAIQVDADIAAAAAAASKKRRVVDVLQEVLGAGDAGEEGSSDPEDEEALAALLDWRAKAA